MKLRLKRALPTACRGHLPKSCSFQEPSWAPRYSRLPPSVSTEMGALIEPLAVGMRGAALSDLGADDVAVVLGLGTIGLSVVQGLGLRGVTQIIASDPSPRRRAGRAGCGSDDRG